MPPFYLQASWREHAARLLGTLTTPLPEWIDGPSNHCHDEDKLPIPRVLGGEAFPEGICDYRYGGAGHKTEFLGRARVHTDGGSSDVALRWQYALCGAGSAGRHAIHFGLWDGVAHAGQPLDGSQWSKKPGNAHPDYALSLGSYSGSTVFRAAVFAEQRIQVLQLSLEISGPRQPEASVRSADGRAVFSRGHVGDEREEKVSGSRRRGIVHHWRKQNYHALAEPPARLPGIPNRNAGGHGGLRHGQ